MNITTYCSAVGIKPVRRYALGLYVGTLSRENFKATGAGVLQILNRNQAGAIDLLGRRSGRDVDKIDLLERDHGLEVERWHGIPIIRGCTAGLLLKLGESMNGAHDCGDHDIVLCDVCDVYAGDRAAPVLTTGFLRDRGLL